jgi:hypothetical protein
MNPESQPAKEPDNFGELMELAPPGLTFDAYMDWLQEKHEERLRRGDYCERYLWYRLPVDAPFRLD